MLKEMKLKVTTPSITKLARTAALTIVENKIPNISNLVKKTGYSTKIIEIEKSITVHDHDKYITTPEFNKLTAENLDARLGQANLPSKSDIVNFVKNLSKKITSNTKHVPVENNLKKPQTFDSSLSIGQSYFKNDGAQFYLIFQPIYKIITTFSGVKDTISGWESKGLSNEKVTNPYITNKILSPKLLWNKSRLRLRLGGSHLKQEDATPSTPNSVANLFIAWELNIWSRDLDTNFTLKDCLFGTLKPNKNADPDKYSYSGYGTGFDSRSFF